MKLAVLIPTVPERAEQFRQLLDRINKIRGAYESRLTVIHLETPSVKLGGLHTGLKRQILLEAGCKAADYVVFIDDDDEISDNYFESIFDALDLCPDVVTFNGIITTDGADQRDFSIQVGHEYVEVGKTYLRPPNHLCPIRSSIAMEIGYNTSLSNSEDSDYCLRLKQSNLIKKYVHIQDKLYHYIYKTTNKLYV